MSVHINTDPRLAELMLRYLYPGAPRGYLTIAHKQGDGLTTRFFEMPTAMDQIASWACRLETDVWFGVGLQAAKLDGAKRGSADSVIVVPAFQGDVDILNPDAHKQKNLPPDEEAAMEVLRASGLDLGLIVRSGYGLHGYVLLNAPLLINDGNRERVKHVAAAIHSLYAAAAKRRGWKIDNVSSLEHIMRLAGTVNYKIKENPKLVTFEYTGKRYSFEEIEEHVSTISPESTTRSFAGFDGFVPGSGSYWEAVESERSATIVEPATDSEFPPAKIEPIVNGCGWMRHCRDDAKDLPEPEWYGSFSILVRCEVGDALAHQWSRPYSNYTAKETNRKIRHALEAAGPLTCRAIREKFSADEYCDRCPNREWINSPITLGTIEPDPEFDAMIAEAEAAHNESMMRPAALKPDASVDPPATIPAPPNTAEDTPTTKPALPSNTDDRPTNSVTASTAPPHNAHRDPRFDASAAADAEHSDAAVPADRVARTKGAQPEDAARARLRPGSPARRPALLCAGCRGTDASRARVCRGRAARGSGGRIRSPRLHHSEEARQAVEGHAESVGRNRIAAGNDEDARHQ